MRSAPIAVAVLGLVACFDPTYRSRVSCADDLSCPPDTYCHFATLTCEATPEDPGVDAHVEVDAPTSDPADAPPPDAPPPDAPPPDAPPPDAAVAGCTVVPQSGCGAGQNCFPDTESAGVCVPAGSVGVDQRCHAQYDCVAGSICTGGVCRKFCPKEWEGGACEGGTMCSGMFEVPMVGLCLPLCDPLGGRICPPVMNVPQGCYVHATLPACYAAGALPIGAACTRAFQCVPGAGCHDGQCRKYCDPSRNLCGDTETCRPLPQRHETGVCTED